MFAVIVVFRCANQAELGFDCTKNKVFTKKEQL